MSANTFDGSFRIYLDPPESNHADMDQPGQRDSVDIFSAEVENVKVDMQKVEKLYGRLQVSNEEIKEAQNAETMRELRARLNADLDYLLRLAKQINKKFDGLVMANAAQRRLAGSSDDQIRATMISDLSENLKSMMRNFQGLRVQMETEHRQLIESRYFAITRDKATADAIDNLIASESPEIPLHNAVQEHGRETVAELQERRDAVRDVRTNLMSLHQIFLGMATPVEMPSSANRGGGGSTNTVESYPTAAAAAKAGTGGLNDYEKETRNQAYIAIALALIIILVIIVLILKTEREQEQGDIH